MELEERLNEVQNEDEEISFRTRPLTIVGAVISGVALRVFALSGIWTPDPDHFYSIANASFAAKCVVSAVSTPFVVGLGAVGGGLVGTMAEAALAVVLYPLAIFLPEEKRPLSQYNKLIDKDVSLTHRYGKPV